MENNLESMKRKKSKSGQVCFYLSSKVLNDLRAFKKKHDIVMSQFVENAIVKQLRELNRGE